VSARRDFSCLAEAKRLKSERSWRGKEQARCEGLWVTGCWNAGRFSAPAMLWPDLRYCLDFCWG